MYLLPNNYTFIARSRGGFSRPRNTCSSGLWIWCFSFKFLRNGFTAKCLKLTLMSCCQIPSRGGLGGGFGWFGSSRSAASTRCPVPGSSVFPQVPRGLIVSKDKTICVLFSVKIIQLSVDSVNVQCLLFIFSLSLWWSNTSRLRINLSAKL